MSGTNNPQANPEVQQSVLHGAAWLLTQVTHHHRGWKSVQAHEPLAAQAVDLARSEASARGVPDVDAGSIQPAHVMAQMQTLGERGVDPHLVLSQSKSTQAAEAEAADSNKDPAERAQADAGAGVEDTSGDDGSNLVGGRRGRRAARVDDQA
jgi:hypothetical protein